MNNQTHVISQSEARMRTALRCLHIATEPAVAFDVELRVMDCVDDLKEQLRKAHLAIGQLTSEKLGFDSLVPQTCTREAQLDGQSHVCGKDGPCNGWPRSLCEYCVRPYGELHETTCKRVRLDAKWM